MNLYISGTSGVGKTTLIERLETRGIPRAKQETLRQMIQRYSFPVPSMVQTPSVRKEDDPLEYLQQLIDWQWAQLTMHTRNMSMQSDHTVVHDRCALDSFVYFLYDVVNFRTPRALSAVQEHGTVDKPAAEFLTSAFIRIVEDQVHSIFEAALQNKLTYFDAVVDNIFKTVAPSPADISQERTYTRLARSIAYILVSYARLLIETEVTILVLTPNAFTSCCIMKDGVRSTNADLMVDLHEIFRVVAHIAWQKASVMVLTESEFTNRSEDIERDIDNRIALISKLLV